MQGQWGWLTRLSRGQCWNPHQQPEMLTSMQRCDKAPSPGAASASILINHTSTRCGKVNHPVEGGKKNGVIWGIKTGIQWTWRCKKNIKFSIVSRAPRHCLDSTGESNAWSWFAFFYVSKMKFTIKIMGGNSPLSPPPRPSALSLYFSILFSSVQFIIIHFGSMWFIGMAVENEMPKHQDKRSTFSLFLSLSAGLIKS